MVAAGLPRVAAQAPRSKLAPRKARGRFALSFQPVWNMSKEGACAGPVGPSESRLRVFFTCVPVPAVH